MGRPKLKPRQAAQLSLVESVPQKWSPPPPLKPLTRAQGLLLSSLRTNTLSFAVGAAGTGKTMVATAHAADLLRDNRIEKIILTRPIVEAGEALGFLPGNVSEKVLPYILPVRNIFYERLGASFTDYCFKSGKIEVVPLAHMRGHSFHDCFVLFDEAQNATPKQMLLFLSRIGERGRVAVTGDTAQSDIRNLNGLSDAIARLQDLASVGIVTFTRDDVVRSDFCRKVLERYE